MTWTGSETLNFSLKENGGFIIGEQTDGLQFNFAVSNMLQSQNIIGLIAANRV
jgi:hypothetical protein